MQGPSEPLSSSAVNRYSRHLLLVGPSPVDDDKQDVWRSFSPVYGCTGVIVLGQKYVINPKY